MNAVRSRSVFAGQRSAALRRWGRSHRRSTRHIAWCATHRSASQRSERPWSASLTARRYWRHQGLWIFSGAPNARSALSRSSAARNRRKTSSAFSERVAASAYVTTRNARSPGSALLSRLSAAPATALSSAGNSRPQRWTLAVVRAKTSAGDGVTRPRAKVRWASAMVTISWAGATRGCAQGLDRKDCFFFGRQQHQAKRIRARSPDVARRRRRPRRVLVGSCAVWCV
mmetsp:Transcript_6588/g.20817  ORF Transcript_6588/g.20817 Transcript_6588/m.20817 type:complete len:228 (-) Transcript_6588:4-687(-)